MTTTTTQPAAAPVTPESQQNVRTDDLLASGADPEDGARGFDSNADPQALQTGMEGIAGAAGKPDNRQSESHKPATTSQTLPDNAGQLRNAPKT